MSKRCKEDVIGKNKRWRKCRNHIGVFGFCWRHYWKRVREARLIGY